MEALFAVYLRVDSECMPLTAGEVESSIDQNR